MTALSRTEPITATTNAYMSWGRWVADCPNPACASAMALEPGQTTFHCASRNMIGACGTIANIGWPDDVGGIQAATAGIHPAQRSWSSAPTVVKESPGSATTQSVVKESPGSTTQLDRSTTQSDRNELGHDGYTSTT